MKELAKIATSPNLDEVTLLDRILESDSWRTVMAVATESARAYSQISAYPNRNESSLASKPSNTGGSRPVDSEGFEEIPPELLEEMGMDIDSGGDFGSHGGSRPRSRLDEVGGGAASGRKKVCPHCTFENDAGATDCDVCGLPLS